jgi:hypothetical protein
MSEKHIRRADHLLQLSNIPWRDIPKLTHYLGVLAESLDDGSNFGRVDGMSVSVAGDLLNGITSPSDAIFNDAVERMNEGNPQWNDGSLKKHELVKLVHDAIISAALISVGDVATSKLLWPEPVFDDVRKVYRVGRFAYSDTLANAELMASVANTYLDNGEPTANDRNSIRPLVREEFKFDAWKVGDYGWTTSEALADFLADAFLWHQSWNRSVETN